MKLPSRPRPSPSGTSGATKSMVSNGCSRCLRDHHRPAPDHAEQAAVEAHAAVLYLEQRQRLLPDPVDAAA